jgi:hypothetical protein
MRVPRPVRWLFVLGGLVLGWLAGGYLQESLAHRAAGNGARPRPASAPATVPATRPVTDVTGGR